MTTRMMTWAGVACLVIGPSALLAQVLVTPVSVGGDPAGQVADAASDLSAMRWALVLDAPLLLFVPAVLIVGAVAGARRSRIAAAGAAVAFIGTLAAVFLLANDILLFEAASSNEPGAIGLVNDYQHNMLFGSMLVLYLAGQVIGCVLLAFALWRKRAVPRWAAVAVGAFPIVGLVFSPVGAVLAVAGFWACALALLHGALEPPRADAATATNAVRQSGSGQGRQVAGKAVKATVEVQERRSRGRPVSEPIAFDLRSAVSRSNRGFAQR